MSAHVIPPLAVVSPGVATSDDDDASPLDAVFTIEDSHLTSSTLPETPPAAYNGGTTYADGDTASVAATGNAFDVYESLQAGNIGNTPASSPLFWKLLGRTYGVYSGAAYSTGDRVIDATNHLEYLALEATTGDGLDDATKWQLQGPTNRWRAFDVLRDTKATGPSGTTFVITPGKRVDAIGFAGLVADSITITLKVAGVTKWTETISLSARNTTLWSGYFFGAFLFKTVSAYLGIPKYSAADFTITLERTAGDVSVGAIWLNEAVYLGELDTEPNLDRRNFSELGNTTQGDTILIRRRSIPEQAWTLFADKPFLRRIWLLPDELNAVPAMWLGLDNVEDEYFEPTVRVAVYTRFTITPGHPDARIDLGLRET